MSILKLDEDENTLQAALAQYIAFHEKMNSKTAPLISKFFGRDARYTAPFMDIYGQEEISDLWQKRLDGFDNYTLKTRHSGWAEHGQTAYVFWEFSGLKRGKKIAMSGMSEILYMENGKIAAQQDIYDIMPIISHWRFIGYFVRKLLMHKTR